MSNPIALLKTIINALADDQETGSYVTLPPAIATGLITGADVTLGAAWANGTTDEIDDGSGVTEDMWIDGVMIMDSATEATEGEIDIGVGESASETWLGTVAWKAPEGVAAMQNVMIPLSVPIFVPSGVRVASRGRGSGATAMTIVLQARTGLKTI